MEFDSPWGHYIAEGSVLVRKAAFEAVCRRFDSCLRNFSFSRMLKMQFEDIQVGKTYYRQGKPVVVFSKVKGEGRVFEGGTSGDAVEIEVDGVRGYVSPQILEEHLNV